MRPRAKNKGRKTSLGIIGMGNMATAIVAGALKNKIFTAQQIFFFEPDHKHKIAAQKKFGVKPVGALSELCRLNNALLLAVKPQVMPQVLEELKKHTTNHLIVTIAAGIPLATYKKYLGRNAHIIRVMPNAPALIGLAATAYCATQSATHHERKIVESLFGGIGTVAQVSNEDKIDAITAVSGSGPAFVYFYAKSVITAAVKLGLNYKTARQLTLQTLLGASQMLMTTHDDIDTLIARVTSKRGTTEAGMRVLKKGFAKIIEACLMAANKRAKEMAKAYH